MKLIHQIQNHERINMLDRDWIWALPGIGWALWTIGGAGAKWVRRFLWAGVIAWIALLYGQPLISSLSSFVLLIISATLPYSPSKEKLPARVLIGLSYGIALFPIISYKWWIVCPLLLTSLFNLSMGLSLKYNWWTHKYTEGIVGFAQGAIVAKALLIK